MQKLKYIVRILPPSPLTPLLGRHRLTQITIERRDGGRPQDVALAKGMFFKSGCCYYYCKHPYMHTYSIHYLNVVLVCDKINFTHFMYPKIDWIVSFTNCKVLRPHSVLLQFSWRIGFCFLGQRRFNNQWRIQWGFKGRESHKLFHKLNSFIKNIIYYFFS